ncbi:MAG: hypothetical protein JNK58_03895 [Phycisphaerae bacterium]|nr:hypothetical protein [Phycisphaerae bacterium]
MHPMIPVAFAALLAVLGVVAFIAARREERPRFVLAGVGTISHVTLYVGGLAAFAVAYHVLAYALDLKQFRAPWWVAVGIALASVLLSLWIDALENRRDEADGRKP